MRPLALIGVSVLCCAGGLAYYAIERGLLIVQWTSSSTVRSAPLENSANKKVITIFLWDRVAYKEERATILWSDDKIQTLRSLVTSWLAVLEDSGCLAQKTLLEAVLLAGACGDEAFISFSRNPLAGHEKIFDRWMHLESLLKTIRNSGIGIKRVNFLVHHEPLKDRHLDVSRPWPIEGFIQKC